MSSRLVYLDRGGGGGILWGAIFISSLESVSTGLSPSLRFPFKYGGVSSIMCSVACTGITSGGSLLIWISPSSFSVLPLGMWGSTRPFSSSSEPVGEMRKIKRLITWVRRLPTEREVNCLKFRLQHHLKFKKQWGYYLCYNNFKRKFVCVAHKIT